MMRGMIRGGVLILAIGTSAAWASPLISLVDPDVLLEASDGRVAAYSVPDLRPLWSVEGPPSPSIIVISPDRSRAAVLDALSDRVAVVDLGASDSRSYDVPATPVAAAFREGALFVLSRDGRAITRLSSDAAPRAAEVPRDATLMAVHARGVFVYGRASGEAVLLDPDDLSTIAATRLPPFASDLEIAGDLAYLVLPREAKLVAFSLETFHLVEQRSAGAVPTDVARASGGTLATASVFAIADPASRRVWRDEGSQSLAAAFGRGMLRGLLGLGLFTPRSAEFPTGVDRVFVANGAIWAFDSSTGSLYRTSRSAVARVVAALEWGAFAVGENEVFVATATGPRRLPLD